MFVPPPSSSTQKKAVFPDNEIKRHKSMTSMRVTLRILFTIIFPVPGTQQAFRWLMSSKEQILCILLYTHALTLFNLKARSQSLGIEHPLFSAWASSILPQWLSRWVWLLLHWLRPECQFPKSSYCHFHSPEAWHHARHIWCQWKEHILIYSNPNPRK